MKNTLLLTILFFCINISSKAQNTTLNNVSIGIDAPAYGIKIKPNFPNLTDSWTRGFFITNETGSQNYISLGSLGTATNGVTSIINSYIGTDYNNQYITFLPNGNTGIGTNPTAKLATLNTTPGMTSFKTVGLNGYLLVDNVGSGENYYNANKFHEFQINGVAKMGINLNGNVGIGINNPMAKLHVNSTDVAAFFKSTTNSVPVSIINDGASVSTIGFKGSTSLNEYNVRVGADGNDFISYTNNVERMRINSNGNIGIGTMAPDEKLTVKGKIHTQEVKVDMTGPLIPDYVFSNDYKLKSLQEVEEYIKKNSHLPEIPSAKEIEKNGLMLAEMNMSLLKKMEEMTLYMINQNKKINELEQQNKKLTDLEKRLNKIENNLN